MTTSNVERTGKYRKMKWLEAVVLCFLIVIISLSVNSCGGTFRSYPNEGDVNGAWDLSLMQSSVSVRKTKLSITQVERYQPFSGNTLDSATLTGTLDRENIVITLHNSDGSTTTLTGTVIDGWKEFSGSYTSTGPDGAGTWSANKVVPISPKTISVAPASATLSCSAGASATFVVTGGAKASYSVTAASNGSLVTISTATLTTNGQFTVTAITDCLGTDGTVVNLNVTDTSASANIPVTISNP